MEQHPIPRQITSFEFKLIGFMTLKQFLYLVVSFPLGYVFYMLIPVSIVRHIVGILVAVTGLLFAFMPVNDRPLDLFVRNLVKRLLSPTQYTFQKSNKPVYFLQNLYYLSDPHKVFTHIESQEKLAAYLNRVQKKSAPDALRDRHRATVSAALQGGSPPQGAVPVKPPVMQVQTGVASQATAQPVAPPQQTPLTQSLPQPVQSVQQPTAPAPAKKQPFLIGIVKNHKHEPLANILVYIKDNHDITLRILKSNPHGVFATYNTLPPLTYKLVFTDPKGEHIFDTMNVSVKESGNKPVEAYSKGLL